MKTKYIPIHDEKLFPWMPEFYCEDVYWLVTVDSLMRGLFTLESDARQLFAGIDLNKADGDVYLWRLNGGHLCRPHVDVRAIPGVAACGVDGWCMKPDCPKCHPKASPSGVETCAAEYANCCNKRTAAGWLCSRMKGHEGECDHTATDGVVLPEGTSHE